LLGRERSGQTETVQLTNRLRRIVHPDPDVVGWMVSTLSANATAELSSQLGRLDGPQVASIVYTSGTT